MTSVGIDLQRHFDTGLLRFESARPSLFGLEMHLARMNRDIAEFAPAVVVVDPISAFRGPESEVHAVLLRLVDICKTAGVTTLFTSLSSAGDHMSATDHGVSSLMDSWISLIDVDANGERLDFVSPFEMGWESAPMMKTGLSPEARRNRDLLAEVRESHAPRLPPRPDGAEERGQGPGRERGLNADGEGRLHRR